MLMTKEVKGHDEAPSNITDHAFEPRGEWYTLCRHCGFARAAHQDSTIDADEEIAKDHIRRYGEVRHAIPKRQDELNEKYAYLPREEEVQVRIGYVGDGVDAPVGSRIGYVGDDDDD
jgi:hypothetical protein